MRFIYKQNLSKNTSKRINEQIVENFDKIISYIRTNPHNTFKICIIFS